MIELKLVDTFPQELIAVDEVGRGPLGGPVVIGAVRVQIENRKALITLLRFLKLRKINDSKKLSTEDRLQVIQKLGAILLPYRQKGTIVLKGIEVDYVTWEMCHETIDQENILAATLRGMKEAAQFISHAKKNGTTLLIDGHLKLRWDKKKSPFTEHALVKGDSRSLLIGLASIIAKEKRDAFMREMHQLYPQYGFVTHYGYPTKDHREAIKTYGPSPIHRKTFKGVKEFLGSQAGAH
jgi:ribonuclease HII